MRRATFLRPLIIVCKIRLPSGVPTITWAWASIRWCSQQCMKLSTGSEPARGERATFREPAITTFGEGPFRCGTASQCSSQRARESRWSHHSSWNMRTSATGTEDTHGRSAPRDQPFSHGLGQGRQYRHSSARSAVPPAPENRHTLRCFGVGPDSGTRSRLKCAPTVTPVRFPYRIKSLLSIASRAPAFLSCSTRRVAASVVVRVHRMLPDRRDFETCCPVVRPSIHPALVDRRRVGPPGTSLPGSCSRFPRAQ
jgi:hypothetical protein